MARNRFGLDYDECPMHLESIQLPSELNALISLAKLAGAHTALEIGAGHGGTAMYLCEKFEKVVSVDLPVELDGTPLRHEEMGKAKAPGWTLVRGDSRDRETLDKVRSALDGRAVGLLLIDGEHTREAALSDYETYRPLVGGRGIIAFHDITMPQLWPLWCELRGRRSPLLSFEFIQRMDNQGLGIGALVGRDENL